MNRTKITALIAIAAASALLSTLTFRTQAGAGKAGEPASAASAGVKVNDVDAAKDPDLSSKSQRDTDGNPRERFIEDLPATENLPRVESQAKSVPAFGRPSIVAGVPTWTALGPFPIPNGQTEMRLDPVSGRVTAIAVHPTDPLIAYVGTAQGGLYRTKDGGTTWVQLMDNATFGLLGTPLAIGAVTIDPTNSSTVLVGTGEGNMSGDSFFGCGFYRITNADGANPTVSGPYNLNGASQDIFSGRSIVSIAVDPADHNNVFCTTSIGVGGIRPAQPVGTLPNLGLYRSQNAFAANPVWKRLAVAVDAMGMDLEPNAITTAVVTDPSNANKLVCALFAQSGAARGGIYLSTNALAATPTFTKKQALPDFTNVKLAINRVLAVVTVYATADQNSGTIYKSTDGGATWANLTTADGFAGGQGDYDLAVAVDPTNASNVYVGGDTGANIFRNSTDGGATAFGSSVKGLHADVHAIAVAPSNPAVIYHGNDGGIWKSTDSGATWTSLNNGTFSATQFVGLAIHPIDPNFSIGGTQDNGTVHLKPDGTFYRADFGDGGYSLIDQNAADNTNVTLYHTYYNQKNTLIGTGRLFDDTACLTTPAPTPAPGNWTFEGIYGGVVNPTVRCDGTTDTFNGIALADTVNFYAPQTLGPGSPNTWYFGTDKLYRSTNRAVTATDVSGVLQAGVAISAIAISPQDGNVRLAGLNNGKVFATTTGANPLLQVAGAGATNGTAGTPATGVGRIVVDPTNSAVAYLAFCGFGTPGTPIAHVWKTTNLDALPAGMVIWTAMSNGLPDVPANALAADANDLNAGSPTLYVGTDIGVYQSRDGGATWNLFGMGLPRVAVFDMAIQKVKRVLRIATHGRGLWDIELPLRPAGAVSRKIHGGAGTFDIDLPFTGSPGIECRSGGATNDYRVVITFPVAVTYTAASIDSGTGTVAADGGSGTTTITVDLTGVTNAQRIVVKLAGVNDGTNVGNVFVPMSVLIGDVNGDGFVLSGDYTAVRQNSGNNVDQNTFRYDINADGFILSGDYTTVRKLSGTQLP